MEELMYGFTGDYLTLTMFLKTLSEAEKNVGTISDTEIKESEKITNF